MQVPETIQWLVGSMAIAPCLPRRPTYCVGPDVGGGQEVKHPNKPLTQVRPEFAWSSYLGGAGNENENSNGVVVDSGGYQEGYGLYLGGATGNPRAL